MAKVFKVDECKASSEPITDQSQCEKLLVYIRPRLKCSKDLAHAMRLPSATGDAPKSDSLRVVKFACPPYLELAFC